VLHSYGLHPYLKTLDKTGYACQQQILQLITNICKLHKKKSFVTFGPDLQKFIGHIERVRKVADKGLEREALLALAILFNVGNVGNASSSSNPSMADVQEPNYQTNFSTIAALENKLERLVPDKPFRPNLGDCQVFSGRVASCLGCKHLTWLERLAGDEQSSLFCRRSNGCKNGV